MLLFAIRVNQLCNVTAHDTYDIQKPLTMSTNCLIDSDSKFALCENCNYIGNPFKFRSFRKPPLKPSHRTIISLMLFICGDVEMNPGPGNSSIYPCGFCDCKVLWTDKGVCCDDCSIWYHKSCISMPWTDYDNLEDFWHCIKCRTPLSHDTFHSYELPTTNRFDSLSTIPGDDSVFMYSPASLSSPGMPRWHSSPYSSRGSKNRSSMSRDDNGSRTHPRKNHNNLRISIINCNGIRSRKAELEYLTEYIKPDILLVTETKIDKSISSSEFLPTNFSNNIRKDRTSDGGGVMIAVRNDLDIVDVELGENQAEIVSAKVVLKGHAPIIISSFYRTPSKHGDDGIQLTGNSPQSYTWQPWHWQMYFNHRRWL